MRTRTCEDDSYTQRDTGGLSPIYIYMYISKITCLEEVRAGEDVRLLEGALGGGVHVGEVRVRAALRALCV